MSFALSAGVTGLQTHQRMLDVTGNNLANVNTTAYKSNRIVFSELLSRTIKKASQPTSGVGGTNPQQIGSGVSVGAINPNLTQGNIVKTGNPLDCAIEGEGYFTLSNGSQNVYTRAGSFGVDANSVLVDPSTGYRLQRIGSTGEKAGFQITGDSNIHVPYDAAMPAQATSEISVSGNLSADASLDDPQTQIINSDISYTFNNGETATASTEIDQLDQFSGGSEADGQLSVGETGTITIEGYNQDGSGFAGGLSFTVDDTTTLGDFVTHLNDNVLDSATASVSNGKIVIQDNNSGYSKLDMKLTYTDTGTLDMPGYFQISKVGGEELKNVDISIYDSQGGKHTLAATFVRTGTPNTWDMVLKEINGDIENIDIDQRRIENITFDESDGTYAGIVGGDENEFTITFSYAPGSPQTIDIGLGTIGKLDGLTQFAGDSTAVAQGQDGYEAGRLSAVSINNEGIVIGEFSNGIKKDIATMRIGLFQNVLGLENIGNGYFVPSANSGEAIATQALNGGAGRIHSSSLEKSNTDVATEFVNMIQAQNGFQANARSIKVASEVLRELSNLIR